MCSYVALKTLLLQNSISSHMFVLYHFKSSIWYIIFYYIFLSFPQYKLPDEVVCHYLKLILIIVGVVVLKEIIRRFHVIASNKFHNSLIDFSQLPWKKPKIIYGPYSIQEYGISSTMWGLMIGEILQETWININMPLIGLLVITTKVPTPQFYGTISLKIFPTCRWKQCTPRSYLSLI